MAASCSEKLAISRDSGMKRSDGRMTGERGLRIAVEDRYGA